MELIPIYIREYFKTKEDLIALLLKTPILDDFSLKEMTKEDLDKINQYIKENTYDKGILLRRMYYGIVAQKV